VGGAADGAVDGAVVGVVAPPQAAKPRMSAPIVPRPVKKRCRVRITVERKGDDTSDILASVTIWLK